MGAIGVQMEQGLLVEGSSHLMASLPCEAKGQALHLSLFTIESTDNDHLPVSYFRLWAAMGQGLYPTCPTHSRCTK